MLTRLMRAFLFGVLILALGFAAGTACGDDDDDDDYDDDDDDTYGPCEGVDLIVEGVTHYPAGDEGWSAYLNIDVESGVIDGWINPDEMALPEYQVTGFRYDQTRGQLNGAFPRPDSIPESVCDAGTITNIVDFTIIDDVFTGDVTFYCGAVDEANLLFVRQADGEVRCGDFAM